MKWIVVEEEEWTFRRVLFDNGTIDIWKGDCAQNPNNPKVRYNLNAPAIYYRLNNGPWESSKRFPRTFFQMILDTPASYDPKVLYEGVRTNESNL